MAARIVIVGGGYAGLWAARALSRRARQSERASRKHAPIDVTLLDARDSSVALPILPDIVGASVPTWSARYPLTRAGRRWGFRFLQRQVVGLDLDARRVETAEGDVDYDWLILATGATTNFHDRSDVQAGALTLHDLDGAREICRRADDPRWRTFVVAGTGPTGVEIATNLVRRFSTRVGPPRVVLVEYAPLLCPGQEPRVRRYVEGNLQRLGIEVHLRAAIHQYEPPRVEITGGEAFEHAQLIWAAGVAPGALIQSLPGEKTAGRVHVDEYLQLADRVYVAGDAAGWSASDGGGPIRMSVQHAIGGGHCAGQNVLREIDGRRREKFRPLDLGWLVPLANGRAIGRVLGLPVRGPLAHCLHYVMSSYRSQSAGRGVGVLGGAVLNRLHVRRFR